MKTMIIMLSVVSLSYFNATAQNMEKTTTTTNTNNVQQRQNVQNTPPKHQPNKIDPSKYNYPENAPNTDNKNLIKNQVSDKGIPETTINGAPATTQTR